MDMKKIILLSLLLLLTFDHALKAELMRNQTLDIDGLQRTYDTYIPKDKISELSPLVLLLHGHGGNADYTSGYSGKITPYTKWQDIADREGWVLVIPDGEMGSDNFRGWNDCRQDALTNPETDDVKFLNTLVDRVVAQYSLNPDRIYAHGTSNGGNMVFRLAMESSEKFKAVASIVAAMPAESECSIPHNPISILLMNGTKDPLVPYHGGKVGFKRDTEHNRGTVASTPASIRYWVEHNNITTSPNTSHIENKNKRDHSRVKTTQYLNKINNTEVILYTVTGGGHTEPSVDVHYRPLFKVLVGRQNRDIEMAEEVFEFFERNNN